MPHTLPTAGVTAVSRQLVHKSAVSEVLLTGYERTGDDTFTVTAQWPRSHSFYDVVAGWHDPLLVVETVRQCIPLLSHLGYGAPDDHRQIWDHLTWSVEHEALRATTAPPEIHLAVRCRDVVSRGGRPVAMVLTAELLRDGVPLGSATTRFTSHSPSVIARLRDPYRKLLSSTLPPVSLPAPVPAEHVGRDRPRDVVLAPGGAPHRFLLRMDGRHPVLFDHETDHVPGMLLVEAARQAAQAVAHPATARITGMDSVFDKYVEFDRVCVIEAEVLSESASGEVSTRVTAVQDGAVAFTAVVTAHRAPAVDHFARSY
ncbi:ScbA/BarX family gamma-butyrolactone biosynthesis protein [Streptomyces sp. NPDC051180]|uniref:ScbA/BarX family gamma-butyrolactone biosynthesis protein n=1 Tax=unclassified Streptomyces TaxID=2593676 RepID=UPI00344B291E